MLTNLSIRFCVAVNAQVQVGSDEMSKDNPSAGSRRPRNAYCSFCRKSHRVVGPLVEGPNDVYICGECLELCQSIIKLEKRRRALAEGLSAPLSSPDNVVERLDRFIGGESEAKKTFTRAVHSHYEWLRHDEAERPSRQGQSHVLLVGPTQSSKVLLSRALAYLFGVPFADGNANALLEDNASSQYNNSPLYKLLVASDFDVEAAQHGMVYLDGIDQPEVQPSVRRLFDGLLSNLLPTGLQMETADILIICGASFVGLDEAIARRGRHPDQPIMGDDLLAVGLIPDLVDRFPFIVRLAPLDEQALLRLAQSADLKALSNDET